MVLCSCGQFTEEGTTLCPRCEALHVLGLGMEAVENEIRSAYRLLSKAWQPGNFEDDPNLKEAAEAKLHDIQAAFDFLTLTSTDRAHGRRPEYRSAKLAAAASIPNPVSSAQMAGGSFAAFTALSAPVATPAPAASPLADPPPGDWQKAKTGFQSFLQVYRKVIKFYRRARLLVVIAAILFVWLTGQSFWTLFRSGGTVYQQAQNNRKIGFLNELAEQMRKLDPRNPVPAPATAPAANEPATAPKTQPRPAERTPATAHQTPPGAIKLTPYITVGSTREEVLAQQGTPTASTEDKLVYGNSEIYLRNNAVVGWRIDRATSPLHVKLWPKLPVDPDLSFFSVGSTKDEVLKIQGTPTTFSEDQFEYDRSIVYFSNNRVVRWKSDPASVTLWAR